MAASFAPGDVLVGRYRIERVLGEGGMGMVLAVQHLVLGELVALKVLLPKAAAVPGVVERFQREARAASRIQSEHVARVMDVGVLDESTPFLVMEYVEGRDLDAELSARGPLPIEEAVSYTLQAMVGVAEAHALGLVHRDLKPANLFLAKLPNGRSLVKVLDFGIAKDTSDAASKDLTSTFSALGSAAYMSPEQVRMAKSVDARSDVWAFGVVLFELLTAQMPFEGESVTAVAAAIIADQPRSLRAFRPDVPSALEAAILACLQKDRERRTPSLVELAAALAPFGGRQAAVYAGRIAASLSPHDAVPVPSAPVPAVAAPRAGSEAATTRPAWTTTGATRGVSAADSEAATAKLRRTLGFAAAAVVTLGLLVALLSWVGRSKPPPLEGSVSPTAAAPAAEHASAPVAAAAIADTPAAPLQNAATPSPTPPVTSSPRPALAAPRPKPPAAPKSRQPGKKPLVTSL
ncbi:MAG TPA: serine/threonine-protein kinase [Polyangiaceae bacterium]|nr:serine/threonine-protein kinase [Polyangiaceae bacterium]